LVVRFAFLRHARTTAVVERAVFEKAIYVVFCSRLIRLDDKVVDSLDVVGYPFRRIVQVQHTLWKIVRAGADTRPNVPQVCQVRSA
jgi:hypothetical protein